MRRRPPIVTWCVLGLVWGCGASEPSGADPTRGDATTPAATAPNAGQAADAQVTNTADAQIASADAALPDAPPTTDAGSPLDATAPDTGGWSSALYPTDWVPGWTDPNGLALPDFSYAGYRNGEAIPGAPGTATRYDVLTFGADPTGATDATQAIQDTIDAARGGGIVFFAAGLYRVDGRLRVTTSSVVLRGEGPMQSRLHFTSGAGLSHDAHLAFGAPLSTDLEIALSSAAETRDMTIEVDDAGDLRVGDDIAIGWTITPEFVAEHGMTGTWGPFNGTWQPFFLREVVSIDRSGEHPRITIDVPLRYPAKLRDTPTLRRIRGYLTGCGVESLGVANAVSWDAAWSESQVHAISLTGVADCWVRDVRSFPSPSAPTGGLGAGAHLQSSGISVLRSKRVTVTDTELGRAQNRGGGGNGYLFEVRQSSEILFSDSVGREGRHNFIQNWGFGTSGCVWLRVHSEGGLAALSQSIPVGGVGYSEFHHSLATANLIDSSTFDDGWSAVNRNNYSSGAGHSATENVFWNIGGSGLLRSFQYRFGYVIGTAPTLNVRRNGIRDEDRGSRPDDWFEGIGDGATLAPGSLYEDQLRRRLAGR